MTRGQVLPVASELGLDFKRIEKDTDNLERITVIALNGALAQEFCLTALAFIAGNEVHPGTLGSRR